MGSAPTGDEDSFKESKSCGWCVKGVKSSSQKLRLPDVTTELSDDEFANPESGWAHKSCCGAIRQAASAKRAAAASEPQRMRLRNAEPKPERENRPAQGGRSTHDEQGTSGEPSAYWSSIQSGNCRRAHSEHSLDPSAGQVHRNDRRRGAALQPAALPDVDHVRGHDLCAADVLWRLVVDKRYKAQGSRRSRRSPR